MTGALHLIGRTFYAIERQVIRFSVASGSLALLLAAATGLYQVASRFVLHQPAAWSESLVQISLIWMVYLTLGGAMRGGFLVSVDYLIRISTGRFHAVLQIFITISSLFLLSTLFWFGCIIAYKVRFQTIAALDMSASWAYAAIPFGCFMAIISVMAHHFDPVAEAPAPAND